MHVKENQEIYLFIHGCIEPLLNYISMLFHVLELRLLCTWKNTLKLDLAVTEINIKKIQKQENKNVGMTVCKQRRDDAWKQTSANWQSPIHAVINAVHNIWVLHSD